MKYKLRNAESKDVVVKETEVNGVSLGRGDTISFNKKVWEVKRVHYDLESSITHLFCVIVETPRPGTSAFFRTGRRGLFARSAAAENLRDVPGTNSRLTKP